MANKFSFFEKLRGDAITKEQVVNFFVARLKKRGKVSKAAENDDQTIIKGSPFMGVYGYVLKVDASSSVDSVAVDIAGKITIKLIGILAALALTALAALVMAKPSEFLLPGIIGIPILVYAFAKERKRTTKLVEAAVNDLKKEY